MLVFRYLAKEVFTTLAALTTLLLLIFLSNQFVHYLARAAAGQLPGIIVLKLMMLEIPNLLGLLLPLGFYMAVLVAYGRLYADSEMTILHACGLSLGQLLRITMVFACIIAFLVAFLVLWVGPFIAKDRKQLIEGGGAAALIQTLLPAQFQAIDHGRRVFYVQNVSRNRQKASDIFLAEQSDHLDQKIWKVVWAKAGFVKTDPKTHQPLVVLQAGRVYQGESGRGDFKVLTFDRYETRLPETGFALKKDDVSTMETKALWPMHNSDLKKATELHWRLSMPLMVIILGFLAVPLSRVHPKQGKFAKLLPAIVIYIIYANMMFITRDWLMTETLPQIFGFWWLHALVLGLALFLFQRKTRL